MLKQPSAAIQTIGDYVEAIGDKKAAARLRRSGFMDEAVDYISSESAPY